MKSPQNSFLSRTWRLILALLLATVLGGCLQVPGGAPETAPAQTGASGEDGINAEAAETPEQAYEPGKEGTNAVAMELLEGMISKYFSCKSYRDKGACTTKFQGDHAFETKVEFHTAFRRPYDFRFEYSKAMSGMPLFAPKDRMIVHGDRSGARTWWSLEGKTEKCESLGMAIAGAGGVSSGSAFNVSNMLLPFDVLGHQFSEDRDWLMLSDAEYSGQPCRRITRKAENGDTTILWIGKENRLLYRMDERDNLDGKGGSSKTQETTVYHPEMDVDINDKELAYGAPGDK